LYAALDALGDRVRPYVQRANEDTAAAIVREAKGRLQRRLGPDATGATVAGIRLDRQTRGDAVLVVSERHTLPSLPLWLEKGTKKGRSTHANVARPYFYSSAILEEAAHFRRLEAAVQDCLNDIGLGELG